MLAVYVITLLCSMAVSYSAPLACEDLVRPLDQVDRHHLEGNWTLVAGGLSDAKTLEDFKRKESSFVVFANATETSKMLMTRIRGFNDTCEYLHSNITVQGSGFTMDQMKGTVTYLHTSCPDCYAARIESKKPLRLFLFSKRRELEKKEMEEFRAQVECLNMTLVVMDPNKDLCSEVEPFGGPTALPEKITED